MSSIPAPLMNLLGLKPVQDATMAAGEDLLGAAKSIPSMLVPPLAGLEQARNEYHAFKTGEPTPQEAQWKNEKAAGYSLPYRGAALLGSAVGVNVPGMEDSAKQGSVGGVLGHTVVPTAMTLGGEAVSHMLPGEHPQVATEAMHEHAATGGSTFEPTTGKNLSGSKKIAVGIAPEHAAISEKPFTPEQYSQFVGAHRDLLARNPNVAVGTYHDPVSGLHSMELVGTTSSKTAATNLASHLGEDHTYNLATDEKIPTGASGDRQPSPMSVNERIADLHSQTPTKSTYSGVHYAETPTDMINGSRRGMPGADGVPPAEAARLRLGSKTGQGKDAPGGFYTYKAGALPDAATASRKNMYAVRGRMAFASTDHPEFQNGYAQGVQNAMNAGADAVTAHQLGLNAAEHALHDAGFDGYYSPKHPDIRFHFGNEPAVPVAPKVAPELDLGSYGPEKMDFQGAVPKDNLGFDFSPPKDYGDSARADVEKRMGGPLPRGKTEQRSASTAAMWPEKYRNGPKTLSANEGGGANYTADDLAKFKAKHGIGDVQKTVENGSGDSAASLEAISRAASEKSNGVQRVKIDTRSGREIPLIGVDAVDAKPGPYEVIVQKSPTGDVELARGTHARR